MQWHFHVELGVGFDTPEIGVQDQLPERVHLHVAQQDLAGRGIEFHVQDGGMERFLLQGMPQRVVVQLDLLGLAGAWLGGWLGKQLNIHFAGNIGYFITAFAGAVIIVLLVRLTKKA